MSLDVFAAKLAGQVPLGVSDPHGLRTAVACPGHAKQTYFPDTNPGARMES
jgi:hypothetical protein